MGDAYRLHTLWKGATSSAPTCYAVDPETFGAGIIPDEEDDETCATSQSQKLIVATQASEPVGFAHIGAGSVEVDGEAIECGIIRFLAFAPEASTAGQVLLDQAEQIFRDEGHTRIDAFPIYHGYPFHNHKVGILSDRLDHISSFLNENGYRPHDAHLTMECRLSEQVSPDPHPDLEIVVEKTRGVGSRQNIRVKAYYCGNHVGTCRSISGCTYAEVEELETCCYTRWIGVDETVRRRGFARHLLTRALWEMHKEGYDRALLNCRKKNVAATSLYASIGYTISDTPSAYFKELCA